MAELNPASLFPKQVAPVRRPDKVPPYGVIDLVHGDAEDLFAVRMALLHGANYNDPAGFDQGAVASRGANFCQECSLQAAGILPEG